jgi:hydrogenase nickel incorporation protein HypA/HybF
VHEFAITESLLKQVLAEAEKASASRVSRVRLLVGEASAVVPDCVQFYFDEMKRGTAADSAVLEFRVEPVRIRCPKCGREFAGIEEMCDCNAGGEIKAGDSLVVESIEVE